MNRRTHLPRIGALAVAGVTGFGGRALACATCFGASDSPLAVGMNMGILSLLFVILAVLGALVAFFVMLGRRAAAAARTEAALESAANNAGVATCAFTRSVFSRAEEEGATPARTALADEPLRIRPSH